MRQGTLNAAVNNGMLRPGLSQLGIRVSRVPKDEVMSCLDGISEWQMRSVSEFESLVLSLIPGGHEVRRHRVLPPDGRWAEPHCCFSGWSCPASRNIVVGVPCLSVS